MKTNQMRLNTILVCFTFLILFQSCTSYKHTIQTDSGTEVKRIKLFNAWVFKNDNTVIKGMLYSADLNGITLAKNNTFTESDFVIIKVAEIAKIKLQKKGQLGKSALIGGVAGAVVGGLIGYSRGDDENIIFSMSKEDKAIVNGLGFGVLGGGLGLIMGTAKKQIIIDGNQRKYDSNVGTIQSYSFLWNRK